MSELLKKQNYGVEVEFTGITRAMAAKAVAEVIGGTVTGPDHTCYRTRIIRDSQGRKWKIMRDSSIIPVRKTGNANMDEYRVEFVTPILKYDDFCYHTGISYDASTHTDEFLFLHGFCCSHSYGNHTICFFHFLRQKLE